MSNFRIANINLGDKASISKKEEKESIFDITYLRTVVINNNNPKIVTVNTAYDDIDCQSFGAGAGVYYDG